MTKKTKLTITIISVMILIIATPFLFFMGIGENPFFDRSNGIKKIAIVNEDGGTEKKEQLFDFGEEMVPILSGDSDYEWVVTSRSATEKGLQDREYDAVVYIPSDFSENIMTYEEQQPVKAEFKYTISDQLNAINREKILREINKATSRVNGKVGTLYWSYVSQDLQKVRDQFDTILDKEMEFLDTISAYYQPNLATVVQDIENQKGLLENLHTAVEGQGASVGNSADQAKQFESGLLEFVTFVEQYKDFQVANQQLLQTMQDENVQLVVKAKTEQEPRFMTMKDQLDKANEAFTTNVEQLEDQLASNQKTFVELRKHASNQQDEIWSLLKEIEGELVVEYENEVIAMRNKVDTAPVLPVKPDSGNIPPVTSTNVDDYLASSKISALEAERGKLQAILQEITNMKGQVGTDPATATEGTSNELEVLLTNVVLQLAEIETNIKLIQQQESQLQQQLGDAQSDLGVEQENTEEEVEEELSIAEKIEQKESEILQSEQVTDGKRNRLLKIFQTPLPNVEEDLLLSYFESLVKYESVIDTQLIDENNHLIDSKANDILDIAEQERAGFEELKTGMPAAQQQLATLKDDINSFFFAQLVTLEADYVEMTEQMDQVEQSANNAREQMNVLLSDTPVSAGDMQGAGLVSGQQSLSQELEFIRASMEMVTDNQANLMAVTNELQTKAQGVNADTSVLNNKWNENVKTTELYRNDIHAILNGAFIDGQKNGQIYEYLATPLATSSLDPTIQQENKMPPVIILAIVLISGLMIGYFCYYFKQDKVLVRMALFVLLNIIVGLIISIYGLDIYPLSEQSSIEWTIFTVMLLTTVSAVIFAGFSIHSLVGWFVTVAVIVFFVTPMLALLATNIDYEDPMSKVYLSIQYGPESLLMTAVVVLAAILVFAAVIPALVKRLKKESVPFDDEASMEV
ncbi:type VII secretion protein EsaA [Lysinibacillus odysseyi]|uniref:Membrane protein n=1 Tax=Lysinibacillus odysseyi 34hs-1 = NBRC 100172 TaxID=1220589 RepID=A0A0A3IKE3_9BACI|nr:type VII secretion protein EsaA [Lysinibacillus odysseyi]KGR83940.1 membrane protein [Lysinibacillus odysseyi 34hs-1 = NBRC 100172]